MNIVREPWSSSRILVFSVWILGYHCSTCDMKPVADFTPGDKVSSSQDTRQTEPTCAAGAITQSASTTRYVVAFGLDWTLCEAIETNVRSYQDPYGSNLTECPHIWFTAPGASYYLHIFSPHLGILFDYLVEHDVRVAFFSGGRMDRNLAVIPELLTHIWGSEKFEALKSKGQFRIHGPTDLRDKDFCAGERGHYVKDLRRILQDGESVANAMLVDDDSLYAAHDQHPIIVVSAFSMSGLRDDYNPLNNIYYLLGLFKTYFENAKYEALPLREGIKQILPTRHTDTCCYGSDHQPPPFALTFHDAHPFVQEMIDVGFAAVREKDPNAILYKKFEGW